MGFPLLRAVLCCAALVLFAPRADAQKLAVKANALSWLTTTPQAAVEGAVGAHWTVGLAGSWNPWTFGDNKKFKHWELRPGGRYWLWESFNGHFFGLSGEYGQYNVGQEALRGFVRRRGSELRFQLDSFSALEHRGRGGFRLSLRHLPQLRLRDLRSSDARGRSQAA